MKRGSARRGERRRRMRKLGGMRHGNMGMQKRARRRAAALRWLGPLMLLLLCVCGEREAGAAGRVAIGMQLEPPTLDPTANPAAAISEALYGNLYEGLVQFAADGSVLPQLAESWDISPDGLTYTFHLRAGCALS